MNDIQAKNDRFFVVSALIALCLVLAWALTTFEMVNRTELEQSRINERAAEKGLVPTKKVHVFTTETQYEPAKETL